MTRATALAAYRQRMGEAGATSTARRSGVDLAVMGVGLALLLVLAAVASAGSVISMMVVGSCDGRCDYGAMRAGQLLYAAGPAVVLLVAAIGGGLLRARGRLAWWVPLVGIALALGLVQLGNDLVLSGVPPR